MSTKEGLEFVPLDVHLDEKLELIEAEFGLKGFAVVVKLWQRIYAGSGYYCEFNKEVELLFSRRIGEGDNFVSEIVRAAINRGIFDKDLYDRYQVLTSSGIQKRYLKATARRLQVNLIKEYLLLDANNLKDNVYILPLNVDISAQNVDILTRREVKGSELKESEIEGSEVNELATLADLPFQKVKLKVKEHDDLFCMMGPAVLAKYLEKLDMYIASKGRNYSSHFATLVKWWTEDGKPFDDICGGRI